MSPVAKPVVLAFCLCIFILTPFQAQAADLLKYPASPTALDQPQAKNLKTGGGNDSGDSLDLGFNLSAAYGRRILPWLRGEVESGWMRMSNDDLKPDSRITGLNDQDINQNTCGMLNLLADFTTNSEVTPFVGIGFGLTKSAMENEYLGPGAGSRITRGGNDIATAYQAMAGVMWNAAPHWGLEFRGRYLDGNQYDHHGYAAGAAASLDADSNRFWVVDVGLSFNF